MTEIKTFTLLPPAKGLCPACATGHAEVDPHNQQSLFWQMKFYQDNGRSPTWNDAMAHCSEETKAAWRAELAKVGVIVPRERGSDGSNQDDQTE